MKRKLFVYIIITSIILVSIVSGILLIPHVRNGQTFTNTILTDNYNHTIIDNTQFDFSNTQFQTTNYNASIIVNDIVSYNENGIITIGSIKNSTNNNHGFIELYSITKTLSTFDIELSNSYLDLNIINETEYLKGRIFNGTLDGESTSSTIALLKRINNSNYKIDFLELQTSSLEYNSTFSIPINVVEIVYDFVFTDIDEDKIPELIIIGTNETDSKIVLAEFTYNYISSKFNLNNFYQWSKGANFFINLKYFDDENNVYFLGTNILNVAPLKSNVLIFSLEKNPIRDFSLDDNLTIEYGTDIFRVYNSKLVENVNNDNQIIALFGTYIDGANNYPFCLKISIIDGTASIIDDFRIEQTPMWSFDGLAVDIDLDGEDEIIMTTYDLLAESISEYSVFTSSSFEEFDSGLTDLRRIRASTDITIESYNIGIFLGKNQISNDVLSFHILHFIPFQFKSTGDILHQGRLNNFSIEPYTLAGQKRSRNDITAEIKILEIPLSIKTINTLPSVISLDIPELENNPITNDLSVIILKNDKILHEMINSITVDYTPEFSITTPTSIIIIRKEEYKNEIFEIKVNNLLSKPIDVNVSIYLASSMFSDSINEIVPMQQTQSYQIELMFMGTIPHSSYVEDIELIIETEVGIFSQTVQIPVTNEFKIIQSDVIILIGVVFVLVLAGYIAFMEAIYRQTKQSYNDYYTKDKPIDINLRLNKKRAISALFSEYTRDRNWKAGIKISQDFDSKNLLTFQKYKVQDFLSKGQKLLKEGKFSDALPNWEEGRKSLEDIGTHEQIDTLDWLLVPLRNIVKALTEKKGSEKATLLQKEFQNLSDMKKLQKMIYNVTLDIPLHLVAEELGLALRDTEELQASLNYLQLAYQSAPDDEKNRIVTEITSLISLGVTPTEFSMPVDHEEIRERISQRTITCFSCGEERTNINEPCSNCGIDTVQCSVCKLPISFGSEYLECNHCQNIAHREHLLEWVKVKGTCPICQQKLTVDKLAVAQEKG